MSNYFKFRFDELKKFDSQYLMNLLVGVMAPKPAGLVGMYSWGLGVLGTSELSFNWGLVVTFLVNFSR